MTDRFPELAEIAGLGDVLLDGELVVLADTGPDFGATLRRLLAKPARAPALAAALPSSVFAFDILRRNDDDLRGQPYVERRAILEDLNLGGEQWTVPPVSEDGAAMVAIASSGAWRA